jgi:hypothetical protein
MANVRTHIRASLAFDHRSVALFRILCGLLVIADVLSQAPYLVDLYTDQGILPRELIVLNYPGNFSLYLADGSLAWVVFLNIIQFVFGSMLITGYHPRWAGFGAYVLLVSAWYRNWLVVNFGDLLFMQLLFLSVFLPVGVARESDRREQDGVLSFWVLAYTAEVICLYFFSYLFKDHPIWREDFTAIYYALRLDAFTTPIGLWMSQFPALEKFATIFTVYVEAFAVWGLILSWLAGRRWWMVRMLVISLFWGLHFGILLTLKVGFFPYCCLIMWTVFIPGIVWDKIFVPVRNLHLTVRLPRFLTHCLVCLYQRHTYAGNENGRIFTYLWELAGAFALVTIIVWNLSTVKRFNVGPGIFGDAIRAVYLTNKWAMYSPFPKRVNNWIEVTGELSDGSRLDLLTGTRNFTDTRYEEILKSQRHFRMEKMLSHVSMSVEYAPHYAAYLCRNWNERGNGWEKDKGLVTVEVGSYYQRNLPNDERTIIRRSYLLRHGCGEKVTKKINPKKESILEF